MRIGLTAWQQEWLERLEYCDQSGLSSKAFAQQHGLDVRRLYWSRAVLRGGLLGTGRPSQARKSGLTAMPKFVQAMLPLQAPKRAKLVNGVVLSIAPGVDETTLRTVVTVLGGDRTVCLVAQEAGAGALFLAAGGEAVSEQLDIVPAKVQVIRHIRKKYTCPCCESHMVMAKKPPQMIEKSNASAGFLA
jgi:hypothetical protein